MPKLRKLLTALTVLGISGISVCSPALAQPQPAPAAATPADAAPPQYIRVVEDPKTHHIRLQLAIRDFQRPGGKGPIVSMAGAVHIADQSFYDTLQQVLDAKDVVLFEGVKPPGVGRAENGAAAEESSDAKADRTKKRQRLLATIIEGYKAKHGAYPDSLDALAQSADKRIGWLIGTARKDAWGHEMVYSLTKPAPEGDQPAFDLTSLGADGAPGGDGSAADLAFSAQKPLTRAETSALNEDGIQEQLAKALGLVFQLKAMDHSKPNWRNSDMSVDQVQKRLDQAGADSGVLFKMLDGSSMTARLAGLALKILGSNPTWSAMGKVMMVQLLSRADELLVAMPDMGPLMEVIIKDRNAVVMEDLGRVLENEPNIKTIGIIYGAGHLTDMERRLHDDLGFERRAERWVTAIDVDLDKAGVSPQEMAQIKRMFDKSIEDQLKQARRERDRAEKRKQRQQEKTTKPEAPAEPTGDGQGGDAKP